MIIRVRCSLCGAELEEHGDLLEVGDEPETGIAIAVNPHECSKRDLEYLVTHPGTGEVGEEEWREISGRAATIGRPDLLIDALEEISSEPCTYAGCEADSRVIVLPESADDVIQMVFDPKCPGEVCTARRALHEYRAARE